MNITVSQIAPDINEDYISRMCSYFVTEDEITKSKVHDIAKIDTVVLSRLHAFSVVTRWYFIFEDENVLTPKMVQSALQSIPSIKGLIGTLCKAKNTLDAEYGVSPDHDPFHDGYTYLWYCGDVNTDGPDS